MSTVRFVSDDKWGFLFCSVSETGSNQIKNSIWSMLLLVLLVILYLIYLFINGFDYSKRFIVCIERHLMIYDWLID